MKRSRRCYAFSATLIGILVFYGAEIVEIHNVIDIPPADPDRVESLSDNDDDAASSSLLERYSDVPWVLSMTNQLNRSETVSCDPFHFGYTANLLSELEQFRDRIRRKTTADLDAHEMAMENTTIVIKSYLSAPSLHEYVRFKVLNSTLFLRRFDHDLYRTHCFIPHRIERLKAAESFSNLQYSDIVASFLWSLVQRYGVYLDRTDAMIQIYDDLKYQHSYDWLDDAVPVLLSDSNQQRSPNHILLHSVSRGLAMVHQDVMPYQGRVYEKLQELKQVVHLRTGSHGLNLLCDAVLSVHFGVFLVGGILRLCP